MLLLKDIVKHYKINDMTIEALKGVNLEFRKNEFVSILGPSGCGKTTLLNIIGGLDRYTSGNLSVNGVPTKQFKDGDWDSYRNNSIGFVFQSYNLISHQTVLSNVELAMTLSGVSKAKRRARAIEVLVQVGLYDQLSKKPNQLSGGQMQRVAIARALVNDPEIVLADEPTGALDSQTSVQIMEMLRKVAKDRLVIMVTHNPQIAETYSTRTIKLLDGLVISDSDPYDSQNTDTKKAKLKKTVMSFATALSLSLNNLMTKKARTFLTAFAGSIGIIGIASILALSNGVQEYINRVEEDTLSSYPIEIPRTFMDMSAFFGSGGRHNIDRDSRLPYRIYSNNIMQRVLNTMAAQITENDLQNFKRFLENDERIRPLVSDIQYGYQATRLNIFAADTSEHIWQVNPSNLLRYLGMRPGPMMMGGGMMNVWQEMISDRDILMGQFEVIAGRFPENHNEVVLVVNRHNEITDFALYSLGLADIAPVTEALGTIGGRDEPIVLGEEPFSYAFDEILDLTFRLVPEPYFFARNGDIWENKRNDNLHMRKVISEAEEIRVSGILRERENTALGESSGFIGFKSDLLVHTINRVNASEAVLEQKANPDTDIFTGLPFDTGATQDEPVNPADFDISALPPEQQAFLAGLSEEERAEVIAGQLAAAGTRATFEGNLQRLGASDLSNPSVIRIFPRDFASKDALIDIIDEHNRQMTDEGNEHLVIHYTDIIGLMMSSVSNIINTVSLVLIAFVGISLVVSSIMIGIITYISVLERTKEIGILRSIGASKRDISRVFNAETLLVGFVAGAIGVGTALLLTIPANIIIRHVTGIAGVASLPALGGALLIVVSMVFTFIAGLIPSKLAAKKDPVVALRTD